MIREHFISSHRRNLTIILDRLNDHGEPIDLQVIFLGEYHIFLILFFLNLVLLLLISSRLASAITLSRSLTFD
jgi:hypothetical protein